MPLLIQGISRAIAFHEVARLSTSRPFDVVLCTTQKYSIAQEKRQLTVFQSYFFFQSLLISLPKTGTHLPGPSVLEGRGAGRWGQFGDLLDLSEAALEEMGVRDG